jgi:hypothetical protein
MLGEFLRELGLVLLGVALLERAFSDQGITVGSALKVLAAGLIVWLSGVLVERKRREGP